MEQSRIIEELLGILNKMTEERGVPQGESLENKNILQGNNPSDPNKKVNPILSSSEIRRTKAIATLFAEVLFNFKKKNTPDEKPKTLITQAAKNATPPPLPKPKVGTPASMLAGLLLLLGGVGALIYGLLNDGPLKGAMNLLSKIGITGGVKLLINAVRGFITMISGFLTRPIKIIMDVAKGILSPFKKMAGALIPKGVKGFGKNIIGKMLGFVKPLLKVLRRIPLIGSLISIGFAISRFMKGDIVGGVIDSLSALSGLLYLVPGGAPFGFAISLGLDIMNAWLDYKAASPENAGKSKGNILMDMVKGIGSKLMQHSLYLPIIGGFERFGMAWDAIKSGNVMEGIKQLGLGLITFVGGGAMIKGIEVLMGWLGSKDDEGSLKSDTTWFSRMKSWIAKKLKHLPMVLRKPLEWFGILDSEGDDSSISSAIVDGAVAGFEGVKNFFGGIWDGLTDFGYKAAEAIDYLLPSIIDSVTGIFNKAKEGLINLGKTVGNWIKNLNPFSGSSSEGLSDSEKAEKARRAGHSSWKEYEKSGWAWKSSETTPTPTQAVATPRVEVSGNIAKPEFVEMLKESAKIQIKLLSEIAAYGKLTVSELRQMSGNRGGMPSVSVIQQPSESFKSLVPIGDNRAGYAGSPYALP